MTEGEGPTPLAGTPSDPHGQDWVPTDFGTPRFGANTDIQHHKIGTDTRPGGSPGKPKRTSNPGTWGPRR